MCPEEGEEDRERAQGLDCQGEAEVIWLVQLGDSKAEG